MYFKKAKFKNINDILEIINQAKENLKKKVLSQWQEDYPNRSNIENDIKKEIGYVLEIENFIRGYIVVDFTEDEAYKNIKGKWNSLRKYVSIHRCAIHDELRGKGYGSELFKFAEKIAKENIIFSIKVNTDPKNLTMKHLFEKNGYKYCGIVFIDGKKVAYEKIFK